jgi:hypothetical protein
MHVAISYRTPGPLCLCKYQLIVKLMPSITIKQRWYVSPANWLSNLIRRVDEKRKTKQCEHKMRSHLVTSLGAIKWIGGLVRVLPKYRYRASKTGKAPMMGEIGQEGSGPFHIGIRTGTWCFWAIGARGSIILPVVDWDIALDGRTWARGHHHRGIVASVTAVA